MCRRMKTLEISQSNMLLVGRSFYFVVGKKKERKMQSLLVELLLILIEQIGWAGRCKLSVTNFQNTISVFSL